MSKESTSTTGGIGFLGVLTIAFIVLKLCHVIEWSWWWVLSPIWIPLSVLVLILIVFLIFISIKKKRYR